MPYFLNAQQKKQNAFITHWPWFVFAPPWHIDQRCSQSIIFFAHCQEKLRCNLQVDSETSPQKDAIKENRVFAFMVDETAIKAGIDTSGYGLP
jgi:hypothetical protein